MIKDITLSEAVLVSGGDNCVCADKGASEIRKVGDAENVDACGFRCCGHKDAYKYGFSYKRFFGLKSGVIIKYCDPMLSGISERYEAWF